MKRGRDRQRTVVVDFSRGSIKMALAESAGEAVRFRGITRMQVPRGPDGEQESSAEQIDRHTARIAELVRAEVGRRGWQGFPAACLLSGAATSTQSFLLPPMPKDDLRRAIALKLGETLHFDLQQASFDYRRLVSHAPTDEAPSLTLVAVARIDAVRQAVAVLRRAGLKPVAIGAAAESLANLSQCTSLWNSEEASIHADIGKDSTILNLFEGNLLRFSREIEAAGGAFTNALMRPILTSKGAVELSYEQAREIQVVAGYPLEGQDTELPYGILSPDVLPLMEPVAQRLAVEIGRSIDYLSGLLDRPGIDRVVLSGPAGRMRNLDRYLEQSLSTPVLYNDPVSRAMSHWRLAVCDEQPPDLAGFAAILGYSLGQQQPINLLPDEERLGQLVQRISRTRKVLVTPIALAGVGLALAGVPLARTFDHSTDSLRQASHELDVSLRERADLASERERGLQDLGRLQAARGPIPDWTGVLKELSAIVPAEVQLTSLEAHNSNGEATLYLQALIHTGETPFDALSAQLAVSLSRSPFFADVRVVEASTPGDGGPGAFEAKLRIIAPQEPLG